MPEIAGSSCGNSALSPTEVLVLAKPGTVTARGNFRQRPLTSISTARLFQFQYHHSHALRPTSPPAAAHHSVPEIDMLIKESSCRNAENCPGEALATRMVEWQCSHLADGGKLPQPTPGQYLISG